MQGTPGLPALLAFDQRSTESSIDKAHGLDMLKVSEEGAWRKGELSLPARRASLLF